MFHCPYKEKLEIKGNKKNNGTPADGIARQEGGGDARDS